MDHKQHSNLSQMPHSNFLLAQPNRFKNNNKRNEVKKITHSRAAKTW